MFEITVGSLVKKYENKVINLVSKQNKEYILNKIRKEAKESLYKEKIFNADDAKLINSILKKIFLEINTKN